MLLKTCVVDIIVIMMKAGEEERKERRVIKPGKKKTIERMEVKLHKRLDEEEKKETDVTNI